MEAEDAGPCPGCATLNVAFLKGVGQSLWGTVTGTVHAVMHPIETAKGLTELGNPATAAVNGSLAVTNLRDKWNNGNAEVKANMIGNVAGDVAQLFIGTEEIKGATEAVNISKSTNEVSEVNKGIEIAEAYKKPSGATTAEQKLSKIEKSKTTTSIVDKYTKRTEVRSGNGPGQSRTEINVIKNNEGKTIKTYKDSYERANKFQHRKPLRGGPEGRPQ